MKKISAFAAVRSKITAAAVGGFVAIGAANAADLDWSGQFRFENHWVNNYGMNSDGSAIGARGTGTPPLEEADGYYIPYAGAKKAQFQTLFLRLNPKLIINDNVVLKSEWWLGNPNSNFYGSSGLGLSAASNSFFSNTSGGSTISAQRFWAEILSDVGTVIVGRAPFHWGLGLVHHSGDGLWDRFQTTGDTVRLNAKFGNFMLSPATTKYTTGEVVGGTWNSGAADISPLGGESLREYSVALKYENTDEDLEGGVNFVRRVAGAQSSTPWINGTPGGLNFSIWDIYAKKKLNKFGFAVEAPIYTGQLIGANYKGFALATELTYAPSANWNFGLKAGKVPGQQNSSTSTTQKWSTIYLNPNYKMGLIMWNYNLRNFAGVRRTDATAGNPRQTGAAGDSTGNVFDNPITNANYLNASGEYRADKWRFGLQLVAASADETAEAGKQYFNQWWKAYSNDVAAKSQGKSYGKEVDVSVNLDWDEFTTAGVDLGYYKPGDFFSFSGTANDNSTDAVMAIVARVGLKF